MWVTSKEAARILGISERGVRKRVKSGKLKAKYIKGERGGGKRGRVLMVWVGKEAEEEREEVEQQSIVPFSSGTLDVLDNGRTQNAERVFNARLTLVLRAREIILKTPYRKRKKALSEFIESLRGTELWEALGGVSLRSIYRWLAIYKKEGEEGLVPRYEDRHGDVPDVVKFYLLKWYLNPNGFTVEGAIKYAMMDLLKRGMEVKATRYAMRKFLKEYTERHYDTVVFMREGQKALKDKALPYISRDIEKLEVGDVLVADGHRANFFVINPATGRKVRPTLIVFYDMRSRYVCGFEIMLQENIYAVSSALRNAIITLGKLPKVVYLDNGKAFRAKFFTSVASLTDTEIEGLFARLGIKAVFAQPYNARAKIVERFFKEVANFERMLPSFSGTNIDDKPPYMKRNEKFHRKLVEGRVLTISQVKILFEKWLEIYHHMHNRSLGDMPQAVFESGRGPGVDERSLEYLMMASEVRQVARSRVRLFGYEYASDELYGYRGKVVVKYSLADMSRVFVYDLRGNRIAEARLVESVHPMVHLEDATEVDYARLKEEISRQRRLAKKTKEQVKELLNLYEDEEQAREVIDNALSAAREDTEVDYSADDEDISLKGIVEESEKVIPIEKKREKPIFEYPREKYEWLMEEAKRRELTEDEKAFIREYMESEEYRLLYGEVKGGGL